MEQSDIDLLNRLLPENQELAQLWREHQELEKKLSDFSQRVYLSPEEEMEMKNLKKVKLSGRDRIEQILASCREPQ